MIRVFFNEEGYYIAGENVEISRRFSPAITDRGDKIFQSIHCTYKILYSALCELKQIHIKEDIMVYGDNRIIDEINGICLPLDDSCDQWLKIIRRHIVPSIRSVIFFRKKPFDQIKTTISNGMSKMMPTISSVAVEQIQKSQQKSIAVQNNNIIGRLRKSWFGV